MDTTEQLAIAVGNNRKELRKRLMDARSCLIKQYRDQPYTVDLANKRILIGSAFSLQWNIRPFPDQPESYHNQQTSVGSCTFDLIAR